MRQEWSVETTSSKFCCNNDSNVALSQRPADFCAIDLLAPKTAMKRCCNNPTTFEFLNDGGLARTAETLDGAHILDLERGGMKAAKSSGTAWSPFWWRPG